MTNIGEAHTVLRPSRGRGPDPRTLFYLMTTTTHALLPSSLTMPARINGRAERADAANAPPQLGRVLSLTAGHVDSPPQPLLCCHQPSPPPHPPPPAADRLPCRSPTTPAPASWLSTLLLAPICSKRRFELFLQCKLSSLPCRALSAPLAAPFPVSLCCFALQT